MVDAERLPMVSLVVLMLAAALSVGGYALGHASVHSADEAATARSEAASLGYRQAVREAQPTARKRGRLAGERIGRNRAVARVSALREAERLRRARVARRRQLLAALRKVRTRARVHRLPTITRDATGQKTDQNPIPENEGP